MYYSLLHLVLEAKHISVYISVISCQYQNAAQLFDNARRKVRSRACPVPIGCLAGMPLLRDITLDRESRKLFPFSYRRNAQTIA